MCAKKQVKDSVNLSTPHSMGRANEQKSERRLWGALRSSRALDGCDDYLHFFFTMNSSTRRSVLMKFYVLLHFIHTLVTGSHIPQTHLLVFFTTNLYATKVI